MKLREAGVRRKKGRFNLSCKLRCWLNTTINIICGKEITFIWSIDYLCGGVLTCYWSLTQVFNGILVQNDIQYSLLAISPILMQLCVPAYIFPPWVMMWYSTQRTYKGDGFKLRRSVEETPHHKISLLPTRGYCDDPIVTSNICLFSTLQKTSGMQIQFVKCMLQMR